MMSLSSYLWLGDDSQQIHSLVQAQVRVETFHFLYVFEKIGRIMNRGYFWVLLHCSFLFRPVFEVPFLARHYDPSTDQ